ncbi:hypothetical protein [Nocardioides sp. GXQ0305]|uniref:hypothetical protein n=1 Tax=Nocardioides sp. GXQ0305 TaxID=3423912 RepID=UPI003D7E969E
MLVEDRLRTALADQAATVRAEAEGPLALVRRRRNRRLTGWAAGAAAALVTVVATTAVLVARPLEQPEPAGPPAHREDPPARAFPLGTYARDLAADEARAAGFGRAEVRHLFGGGEQVTVLMTFRSPSESQPRRNAWVVRFVGGDGERRVRDGGDFQVGDDGELDITSLSIECFGCVYHFDWSLQQNRLILDATAEARSPAMQALLDGGTWERQRP